MRTKVQFRTFDEVLDALRKSQFDVREAPGVANHVLVRKFGVGAILTRNQQVRAKDTTQSSVLWVERPGFLLGGEVATLLDRGYQKFWKTARLQAPATADSLHAVHRFSEELREIVGEPSLYNESLGTTSDSYLYDRLKGRDLPVAERPKPAWELPPGSS